MKSPGLVILGSPLWPGALWLPVVLESPSIIVIPILQMEKPRLEEVK